jgi:hypothetical protein
MKKLIAAVALMALSTPGSARAAEWAISYRGVIGEKYVSSGLSLSSRGGAKRMAFDGPKGWSCEARVNEAMELDKKIYVQSALAECRHSATGIKVQTLLVSSMSDGTRSPDRSFVMIGPDGNDFTVMVMAIR